MLPPAAQKPALSLPVGGLLLLTWVLANYAVTCGAGLSNDDFIWIDGAWIAERQTWWHAALVPHPWWSRHFVRPVVQVSFFLNHLAGGIHPWTYHAVNVGLHVVNVLLVWRLAADLFARPAPAMVSALLFSVQPYNSWAVAWVSGRTQLLCASFVLVALRAHLRNRSTLLVGLYFAGALLANEAAIVFPVLALGMDALLGRDRRRAVALAAVCALIILAYLPGRAMLTDGFAHGLLGVDPTEDASLAAAETLLRAKITLLGQYLLAPLPVHGFWRAAVLLFSLGAVGAWLARRPVPPNLVALSLTWIVVTLLPFAAWYQFQPWYIYVPSIGLAFFLVALTRTILERPRAGGAALTVAVAAGWLGASVVALQHLNVAQWHAGRASIAILQQLQAAVPAPARSTRFCLDGLGPMRLGADPEAGQPVMVFGLHEAVRLWFRDPSLQVEFADPYGHCPPLGNHPSIALRWDSSQRSFRAGVAPASADEVTAITPPSGGASHAP